MQSHGIKKQELTEQEDGLLKEFLSLPNAKARTEWVIENRSLFECQEGQTAVFHSQWVIDEKTYNYTNRIEAEQFCEEFGNYRNATILEWLPGGRIFEKLELHKLKNLDPYESQTLWGQASTFYAESADGSVFAFHHQANPQRILIKDELPALLKNEKVTHINYVPVSELKPLYNENAEPVLGMAAILQKTDMTRLVSYDGDKPLNPELKNGPESIAEDLTSKDLENSSQLELENAPEVEVAAEEPIELEIEDTTAHTFEVELENGENRLLEVESGRTDEELRHIEISDELAERLEKQKPEESLKIDAEEIRKTEELKLSPEPSDEQKPQFERENQTRIFELELDNGEKRLLEVEGLKPEQDLNDVELNDELIHALAQQPEDKPLKISVGPLREELEQQQQQKQSHGLMHLS